MAANWQFCATVSTLAVASYARFAKWVLQWMTSTLRNRTTALVMRNPALSQSAMVARVRTVEDAWNLRDLDAIVLGSSIDCQWRCHAEFLWGRGQVRQYLTRKWRREIDLRVIKELWVWDGQRIAIRFSSEFRDDSGTWFRTYGNENWECDSSGLVRRRLSSANAHPIEEHERKFRWPPGVRPADYAALSELGL